MRSSRTTADGVTLATYHWDPPGAARSTVVLLHGLAEHTGRYEHVAELLTARGHRVIASDLRGFGRSEGRRAYVRSVDTYLDDIAVDVTTARSSGTPVVLLGHSMGGLLAVDYALSERPAPDLLVASSPMLDADLPLAKRVAARVLGVMAPRFSIQNELQGSDLSRDPSVGERYFDDPLVQSRTTAALGRALLASGRRCRQHLTSLELPTLVIHGGADPLVPPGVTAPIGALPSATRVLFPAFRHESFNEEGGEEAVGVVAGWLDEQLGQ